MIWSARSTDWTPPSLGSLSPPESPFGPIVLRRITFLFIATCIHPLARLIEHDETTSPSPRSSRGEGWGEGLSPRTELAESPPHPKPSASTSPRKRGEVRRLRA